MEYAYATTHTESEIEAINYELAHPPTVRRRRQSNGRRRTTSTINERKTGATVQILPASDTPSLPEKHQPVNQSRSMQFLLHRAELVARLPVPVIIAGASGTGKSQVAHYVHRHSERGYGPLVELNCRAFASERSGASQADDTWRRLVRRKLSQARNGTLWVRQLEQLDAACSRELLGVLCETQAATARSAHARLILTMPVDAVFEADCRNRLGAVMLVMPTLAERREDILPLARTFLKQFASEYNLDRTLNARAVEYIKTYAWPGNVRQLQSTLLNALIQAPGQTIRYEDLATFTGEARSEYEGGPVPTFQEQVENFERGLLQSVLEQCHGNQSQVSRMLQMNRGTLIRKIKQYELDACGRPGFWQSDTV